MPSCRRASRSKSVRASDAQAAQFPMLFLLKSSWRNTPRRPPQPVAHHRRAGTARGGRFEHQRQGHRALPDRLRAPERRLAPSWRRCGATPPSSTTGSSRRCTTRPPRSRAGTRRRTTSRYSPSLTRSPSSTSSRRGATGGDAWTGRSRWRCGRSATRRAPRAAAPISRRSSFSPSGWRAAASISTIAARTIAWSAGTRLRTRPVRRGSFGTCSPARSRGRQLRQAEDA